MPGLANRVDAFGRLFTTSERGGLLGNRGGRFHDVDSRTVRGRPFASKQWICCRLSFKERRRQVWSRGYTELFFCDEVSALAAGHRPCFECRREDATAFAAAWSRAFAIPPPRAPQMDAALHVERLAADGRGKRLHALPAASLPEAAVIARDGAAFGIRDGRLLRWSFRGFGPPEGPVPAGTLDVLTPPAILACLRAGYRPAWRIV